MMKLYSGTTCPFSHRCRFVLYEKGMDFQIIDVDLYNKPEDIAVMNPYNQVPVLVERDLILYESNIINEYIDERFPHPQLMPADPVMRARARLFLFNFEKELFTHIEALEAGKEKQIDKARQHVRDRLIAARAGVREDTSTCWATTSRCSTWRSRRCCGAWTTTASSCRKTAAPLHEVRRAHLLAPGVHRGADAVRKGDAQVSVTAMARSRPSRTCCARSSSGASTTATRRTSR